MEMPQSDFTFCIDILYSSLPFVHIFLIKAQVVESCTFTGFSLQPISEMAIQWCLLKQVNYLDTLKIVAVFLKCWKQSPTSNRELFFNRLPSKLHVLVQKLIAMLILSFKLTHPQLYWTHTSSMKIDSTWQGIITTASTWRLCKMVLCMVSIFC